MRKIELALCDLDNDYISMFASYILEKKQNTKKCDKDNKVEITFNLDDPDDSLLEFASSAFNF